MVSNIACALHFHYPPTASPLDGYPLHHSLRPVFPSVQLSCCGNCCRSSDPGSRSPYHDTTDTAAYIVSTVASVRHLNLSTYSYWTFSDVL